MTEAGEDLLDDDGSDLVTDEACCCIYRRAQDPCNGDAYVDAWMQLGHIPADYVNCGGTCYKLAAGQTQVPSLDDVPPGHVILDPDDCVATNPFTDPDCCPPVDCGVTPTGLNPTYVVTATFHPMIGGDNQPCGYRCEGEVNITVRNDVDPDPLTWVSNPTINLCTHEGSSEPEHSGQITLKRIGGCAYEIQFDGDQVGASQIFRKYTGVGPEGDYALEEINGSAITPEHAAEYDCDTDGRTRFALQENGIRLVSVG
jgi:hypothetical protein